MTTSAHDTRPHSLRIVEDSSPVNRFSFNQALSRAFMHVAQKIEQRVQARATLTYIRATQPDGAREIEEAQELAAIEHAGAEIDATAIAMSDAIVDVIESTVASMCPPALAAIDAVTAAATVLALAVTAETETADTAQAEKSAAILRLMETENVETHKPHTATSAEKVVKLDEQYAAFLKRKSRTVVDRIAAEAGFEVAKLHARLAVRLAPSASDA